MIISDCMIPYELVRQLKPVFQEERGEFDIPVSIVPFSHPTTLHGEPSDRAYDYN